MRASWLSWVWVVVVFAGCRDLGLPPLPGNEPGTITGRIVWLRPGRLLPQPAAGAGVFLLGTNLSAAASADGRFVLDGITSSTGTLLVRFDADGNGSVDFQRTLSLEEIGAGRGRTVFAGELQLSVPASITGQVVLADQPGGDASGSSVFVPGLPLGALTAADGEFLIEGVVEGDVRVAAVRPGYVPFLSASLALRGGEELRLSRVTLQVDAQPNTAQVRGRVVDLSGAPVAGANVTLGTFRLAATTNANGEFLFGTVPTGRYDVRITAPGRAPLALFNLLVVGGEDLELPELVLAPGSGSGPVLVEQVDSEVDAGSDFTVTIESPLAPLNLARNEVAKLAVHTANPDVLASGATVQWSVSPTTALLFDDPLSQTVNVTGNLVGSFRVDVVVTFNGAVVSQTLTGRVSATGNVVMDAGATAIAAWVDVSSDFVAASMVVIGDGGTVAATSLANPLKRRVVALFAQPTTPGGTLSLRTQLTLADGGAESVPTAVVPSAGFNFSAPSRALDAGNTPPEVGAGILPEGFFVTATLGDGAPVCANFACFAWTFPPGRGFSDVSGMPPVASYTGGRRVVVTGQKAQSWYGATRSMDWTGSSFSDVAVPPGATFADGPTLSAASTDGGAVQLHTWNGVMWTPGPSFAVAGGTASSVVGASSPSVTPMLSDLWALVVRSDGDIELRTRVGGMLSWSQVTTPTLVGVESARLVATRVGAAFIVSRGTGGAGLFTTSRTGLNAEHSLGALVPLDLVAIGTNAFVLCRDPNSQLVLELVDIANDSVVNVALPSIGNVRDGELAAGDFGELGLAWSAEPQAMNYVIDYMLLVP